MTHSIYTTYTASCPVVNAVVSQYAKVLSIVMACVPQRPPPKEQHTPSMTHTPPATVNALSAVRVMLSGGVGGGVVDGWSSHMRCLVVG